MRQLVDQKIREIDALLEDFDSEMIVIEGSRNYLIRALTSLFDELENGDSWSTVTAPEVWQAAAVGLDGRYRSASIGAIRRGAAINRGYLISVEELGVEWCENFIDELDQVSDSVLAARDLSRALERKLGEYRGTTGPGKDATPKDASQRNTYLRFEALLSSLRDMVTTWELAEYVNKSKFNTIVGSIGCFLGLIPTASARDVCSIRRENPASLMYRADPDTPTDEKWLLVMTDIRGRSEIGSNPQLLGFRVYRSVMESRVPTDRIIHMERLLSRQAINIGPSVTTIADCAERATLRMKSRDR